MGERKKLIDGFYGDSRNDKQRLDESLLPTHYAISLSGEPTMYPKLPELIKYLKSLEATKSIFLRITLIRNYNDQKEMIPAFADMFRKASPHFIEIKSYMHIGRSTNRLEHENMLEMHEVKKFSEQIAKQSKIFSIMDESLVSRISILQNNERFIDRWIPTYANTN